MLVRAVALAGRFFRWSVGGVRLVRRGFGDGAAQQRLAVVDGGLGSALEEAFALEAAEFHLGIGGDQHQVGFGDLAGAERALRAHRTLGFHADGVAQRLSRLAQAFRRHEGVGDAGGAGGDGDDAQGVGLGRAQRRGPADGLGRIGQGLVQAQAERGQAVQARIGGGADQERGLGRGEFD